MVIVIVTIYDPISHEEHFAFKVLIKLEQWKDTTFFVDRVNMQIDLINYRPNAGVIFYLRHSCQIKSAREPQREL